MGEKTKSAPTQELVPPDGLLQLCGLMFWLSRWLSGRPSRKSGSIMRTQSAILFIMGELACVHHRRTGNSSVTAKRSLHHPQNWGKTLPDSPSCLIKTAEKGGLECSRSWVEWREQGGQKGSHIHRRKRQLYVRKAIMIKLCTK